MPTFAWLHTHPSNTERFKDWWSATSQRCGRPFSCDTLQRRVSKAAVHTAVTPDADGVRLTDRIHNQLRNKNPVQL
jgi:hypothetical protein